MDFRVCSINWSSDSISNLLISSVNWINFVSSFLFLFCSDWISCCNFSRFFFLPSFFPSKSPTDPPEILCSLAIKEPFLSIIVNPELLLSSENMSISLTSRSVMNTLCSNFANKLKYFSSYSSTSRALIIPSFSKVTGVFPSILSNTKKFALPF